MSQELRESDQHRARIRQEFTRQADAMAASAVFTDDEILRQLREAAGLTRQTRVLDLACGPGIVAEALARDAGHVIAVDLTPTMLARAQSRCTAAGLTNVHCALSLAETLPFADKTFDVVVNRSAMHHFPNPSLALSEMARVTRPFGRVVISDVVSSEEPEESTLHNALEVLRDPSHVRMIPQSELVAMLRDNGLSLTSTIAWTNQRDVDEWTQITNAPERKAALYPVMSSLAKAGMQAGINLHLDGETVRFEHHSRLFTAIK